MDAFWTKTLAQRLKFPKAVISLQHLEVSEISIGYALFFNKLPPQETNLPSILVSGETPSTKQLATKLRLLCYRNS